VIYPSQNATEAVGILFVHPRYHLLIMLLLERTLCCFIVSLPSKTTYALFLVLLD
jgi:hypothetical protein